MIKFIKNYFKMKTQEIQLKLTIYPAINGAISGRDDIKLFIKLGLRLFNVLKDLPIEEYNPYTLKQEIIEAMANIINEHAESESKA